MNEPTEIKYSLDESGEPYFAATHIQAVQGLNFNEDEDLSTVIFNLQKEVNKVSEENTNLRNTVEYSKTKISELNTNIETSKNTIETLKTKTGSLEVTVKNLQDEIEQLKGSSTNEEGSGE
ncbi:hypothetical protein [Staphylococcus carnosus]|uniref:hypothetical protein n=1 Tax=Staphylococcus carnosus TaxID=1281 RepID=UPI000CD09962|nr:hypothetical protein [Staphylococcus carnosus]PNZ96747.1 hypothetical protein CD153_12725 [Staphylococcus carnosus]QRQ05750.1 hypothetical protein I6J34_03520 [Staphylococcus carnosus]UTB82253.1 hypothetical protein A2I67_02625 [Staphylococcus carnosus]SUM07577.1 Uncharacterised protein [Staphylococcus carnosus]GEP80625.1 hypothetical protein SCA05_24180 [Staphylococcus carnosus]